MHLVTRLERGRQTEYTRLEHGKAEFFMLRLANILSVGMYRHREDESRATQLAALDTSRRLAYHRRFVQEVLDSTPIVEVGWDVAAVRRSLEFIATHAPAGDETGVKLLARAFEQTRDRETRLLCVNGLARAGSRSAQQALARLYASPDAETDLRALAFQALGEPSALRTGSPGTTVLASARSR